MYFIVSKQGASHVISYTFAIAVSHCTRRKHPSTLSYTQSIYTAIETFSCRYPLFGTIEK